MWLIVFGIVLDIFLITFSLLVQNALSKASLVTVKNVTLLGPQVSPGLSGLSRDGGASVLLDGKIIWLFDDTQVLSGTGQLELFVSNTASYSDEPNDNITLVQNFGISTDPSSTQSEQKAVAGQDTLENGGWIPFMHSEAALNEVDPGKERIAIWPGTNPLAVNPALAYLYAPIVLVQDSNHSALAQYLQKGVTLLEIKAAPSGPQASRPVDTLFTSQDIPYGTFAALAGTPFKEGTFTTYLLGKTTTGLQLARVESSGLFKLSAYEYFRPYDCTFVEGASSISDSNVEDLYLPGSFSSGSVFYSPVFKTFLLIYFNDLADSTFYIRYLDLDNITCSAEDWIRGGKKGRGIQAADVESLFRYTWSPEQVLYKSPPGPRGYNYAGVAHPEFWNKAYYSKWMYSNDGIDSDMDSGWYGSSVVNESQAPGDGQHLLLSWTSQENGPAGTGRYQVMLAKLEFALPTDSKNSTMNATPSVSAGAAASPRGGARQAAITHITLLCLLILHVLLNVYT